VLADLLKRDRAEILDRWFDLILQSYPADSAQFLRQTQKQFANPVGYTIAREIGLILDSLLDGASPDADLSASLDRIIRIRSVQEFTASQAVGFVFRLKSIIHELAKRLPDSDRCEAELREIDTRIDRLALMAFDVYVKCREEICEIKVNEFKRQTSALVRRLNPDLGCSDLSDKSEQTKGL